VDSTPE
jgi:ubiquitin carboxyl-terminal hydrolase 34